MWYVSHILRIICMHTFAISSFSSIAPCRVVCANFAHTSSGFNSPSLNTLAMCPNSSSVFLKQLCHLRLCEPHRFVLHTDINLCLPVLRLIDDYLVVLVRHTSKHPIFQIFTPKVTPFLLLTKSSSHILPQ